METIRLLELFSGIQSQERALRQLNIPYESVGVCDCDKEVLVASAAMRFDLAKEIANYDFPSTEVMIDELQQKNIGFDFVKQKHTITSRTPITKLKQYYISDKLLKNLGDISKVERLPRANFVTYSSPCQSFSVAGKLAGAAKTCTKCGHKWDIDFSNPDYNYKCPVCGSASLESTTSGLLQEVQRLLSVAYEENELPAILLMENVKNLVQKKFIGQFEAWVRWLDSIGYNTYWKVLNAKHFGVPQSRERVFAISVRKDVDTNGFIFPDAIPLTLRLKDVLEKNVDEKYYLPDERLEKILNATFMKQVKPTGSPEVHQIMNVMPGTNRPNPNQGRVYDKDGIAPALTTMEGGSRQPFIIEDSTEIQKILDIPKDILNDNERQRRVYSPNGISHTLLNRSDSPKVVDNVEPFIVASRGRNPENPSDRTTGAPTEQRLEPNFSGCSNTLTSVQKDNYVCEPMVIQNPHGFNNGQIREDCPSITSSYFHENNYIAEPQTEKNLWTETQKKMITEYGNVKRYINSDVVDEFNVGDCADISFPNGYNKANRVFDGYSPAINGTTTQSSFIVKEPIVYDDYNSRISADQDAINTLTCNCGASAERNGVKIIEPVIVEDFYQSREPRVYTDTSPTIRSERTGLKAVDGEAENKETKIRWRIRKLTAKECWRLMNFTDEDNDRAARYVSDSALYKQAGNSIVVACLIAIMSSLFIEDGHKAEVWTQYILHFND